MILLLNFHGLGPERPGIDRGEASVWLSRERFAEIVALCRGREGVGITFDDGNRSDIEIALPALLEHGLRAEFFVVADRIGVPGYLSADDLRTLGRAGMTIGSHGKRHRPWRGLPTAELAEEIETARDAIAEAAGAPVDRAACPFGSYDRRSLAALRRAGFRRVYTSDGGPTRADAWLQARNTVHRDDDAASVGRLLASSPPPIRALVGSAKRLVKRWR